MTIRTEPARARPNPAADLQRRAARIAGDALLAQGVQTWDFDEHGSSVPTAAYAQACKDAEAALIAEHGDPMVAAGRAARWAGRGGL